MNSIQRLAIDNLKKQRRNAREKGFYRAVLEAMCDNNIEAAAREEDIACLKEHHVPRPPFLPDLYEINRDEKEIILYEIEDTHPISSDKLNRIERGMCDVDCYAFWDLQIFVTDRYGLNLRRVYRFHDELDDDYEPLLQHIALHNAANGHIAQFTNDERCHHANLYLKWFALQERERAKEAGSKNLSTAQRTVLLEDWRKMVLSAPENQGLQLAFENLQ